MKWSFVLTLNRASALTGKGEGQNILLLCKSRFNTKKIGLESKRKEDACFWLSILPLTAQLPVSSYYFSYNCIVSISPTSKLRVKTRTMHTANQTTTFPEQHINEWTLHLYGNTTRVKFFFHRLEDALQWKIWLPASPILLKFCFNSKPSFSFDRKRQGIKYTVAIQISFQYTKGSV